VRFYYLADVFYVVIACLVSAACAEAQELSFDDLELLTPAALVAEVESRNHSLQSLAAAVEAAQLRIVPAAALDDPTLGYMMLPRSIGSSIGYRHGVQVAQRFPWPGKRDLHGAVASQQRDVVREGQAVTRLDVITAAKASFAEWHYLHRAIEINAASQSILDELVNVAQARYAAGRVSQQDVLRAEVELILLMQQRLTLDQEKTSVRASMNLLLNRNSNADLPPPAPLAPPGQLPDIETARAIAEESHPELRRQEALLAAGLSVLELADKAFFPDFSAYFSYADAWDERDKRMQLGITINVPLARNKRHAELDAAHADVRRSEHELQGHRAMLLAAMETAYAQTLESMQSMALYQDRLLPLAQASLDLSMADYRSGSGQLTGVLLTQRQQLSTELGFERARADYARRRAEFERSVGAPLAAGYAHQTALSIPSSNVVYPLLQPIMGEE
jgi:cobalt-zinc-cadmium efflux system outer membrane protein